MPKGADIKIVSAPFLIIFSSSMPAGFLTGSLFGIRRIVLLDKIVRCVFVRTVCLCEIVRCVFVRIVCLGETLRCVRRSVVFLCMI